MAHDRFVVAVDFGKTYVAATTMQHSYRTPADGLDILASRQ